MKSQNKVMSIVGWVLSALVVALLTFSATMKLRMAPEDWAKSGYPENSRLPIAIAEIACVVLYLVPQTAVLGAVLATGYLGGAVATHVRGGENFASAVIAGVVIWLGLFFRDPRVRAILPWRGPLEPTDAKGPPL